MARRWVHEFWATLGPLPADPAGNDWSDIPHTMQEMIEMNSIQEMLGIFANDRELDKIFDGLLPAEMRRIIRVAALKVVLAAEPLKCAVCLCTAKELGQASQELMSIHCCNGTFCMQCLDQWNQNVANVNRVTSSISSSTSTSCPLCRSPFSG
mmetsp:Transcript_38069/g.60969  ORF Transcript_38069/g.60969 Transcript_38069/m.60969 type:complete len:153 (-) Transcript_38069:149-607(-)